MAKRGGLVVVASGPGWALAWPRERWDTLTAAQQQDVIAAQVALLSQSVPKNGTYRSGTRRAIVGAPTGAAPAGGRV